MRGDGNGAHPWASATVGDTKGFVQVEMAHIGPECTWMHQANHGIHIGAIQIDLASMRVHDFTDLANAFFEDAMGRGVCHH